MEQPIKYPATGLNWDIAASQIQRGLDQSNHLSPGAIGLIIVGVVLLMIYAFLYDRSRKSDS